jgi:hypothetical protein
MYVCKEIAFFLSRKDESALFFLHNTQENRLQYRF